MTATAGEKFVEAVEAHIAYADEALLTMVDHDLAWMPTLFCPVCESVVDHTGCDCGEFLPTYDPDRDEEE
ncbi:hypothetical protein [Rhodococcus koreensis]